MEKIKKNDFIEIEFTGTSNGNVFDSNIPEDLKKISEKAEPQETIVIVGQGMVVPGFDKALEDKEIGKEYDIHISSKEGFGPRKRELLKTIPLHVFTKHKVNPYPGAVLYLDNSLVRVITVSGARVITDFNNPLAGKDLDYKFKIKRIILEEKEKINAFFKFYFKFIPDIIIEAKKITVRGKPEMEPIISIFQKKFHEIFKKDLEFKPDEKPHQKKSNETIEKEITPK